MSCPVSETSRSVTLVRIGCHLQLRQIEREQCRTLFEDSEGDDEPLQRRPAESANGSSSCAEALTRI
jgi:hypothetical protein